MSTTATIQDVTKRTGLSPATKNPVDKKARQKILKAMGTVYEPSLPASQVKQGKSGLIGCLAADITETFVNQIIRGIEQGLGGGEYSLIFVSGIEFGNDLKKAFDFLKSNKVDGILFCNRIPLWPDFSNDIKNAAIPIVSVNMDIQNMISVILDNRNGGYQAADHLFGCGMRNPAMICGPEDRRSVKDRLKGFMNRLREQGLPFDESALYFGPYEYDHGYQAAKDLMDTHHQTDGIFCANDYIAAGVIARLQHMDIEIPRQVRVLGFDNRDFSSFWNIPITTFELPLQEMGMLGMGLLRNCIDTGTYIQEKRILQPKLIPRMSTRG
jgi:LacI family transcriptional regulator